MATDIGNYLSQDTRTAPITEQPSEFARDIDSGCASDIVRTLCQCNSQIFSGWENYPTLYDAKTISTMVKISEWAVEVLENSNDTAIVLSGCGTSGRLAFLLARKFSRLAEAQQMSVNYDYLIAGGDIALLTAQEATEDNWRQGREDLERVSGNKSRVLFIGITCGLSAPYVAAQLDYCMCHPDVFIPVLIGFNPLKQAKQNVIEGWNKSFFQVARSLQDYNKGVILNPVIGPEAITGSTRLKGGSATKIILESILLHAHITLKNSKSTPINILLKLLAIFNETCSSTYRESTNISRAVELGAQSLQSNGHVYYLGWGFPGFMGLLDASECVPTFSANYDDFRGFLQGGYRFLKNSHGEMVMANSIKLPIISLEDFRCMFLAKLTSHDTIIFICTGVKDMEEVVRLFHLVDERQAHIVGIFCEGQKILSNLFSKCFISFNQPSKVEQFLEPELANFVQECQTEIFTKLVLNAVSTGAHVLKGKVVGSAMIDLRVSNSKLFHRAVSIVSKLARVSQQKSLHCVLQSIYRTGEVDNVLSRPISEHVAKSSLVKKVVPVAVLVATGKFSIESALTVLKTKTVSSVLRDLNLFPC